MIVVIVVVVVIVVLLFWFDVSVSCMHQVGCCCWGCGCVVTHTTPREWPIMHIGACLTGEGELAGRRGRGRGDVSFPPTSIGQNPADVNGEVFGGENVEERGVPLKRRLGSS